MSNVETNWNQIINCVLQSSISQQTRIYTTQHTFINGQQQNTFQHLICCYRFSLKVVHRICVHVSNLERHYTHTHTHTHTQTQTTGTVHYCGTSNGSYIHQGPKSGVLHISSAFGPPAKNFWQKITHVLCAVHVALDKVKVTPWHTCATSKRGWCCQHHAPAILPPKKTRYPLYRRMGGPRGHSGRQGKSRPYRQSIPGTSST